MKCRVCGKPANISLSAYHTALCAEDFTDFIEKRVLTTINKYSLIKDGDTPVVAVSGGKDSLALWHIMNKLGFPADGIYIDLGIENYSDISLLKIKKMADDLKRKVFIFHFRDMFGKGIEELAKTLRRVPCSACGMVKRYVMNKVCMDYGYSVLMTGHNLDDEASALLGNVLYWKDEYLWKKDVLLEGREGRLSSKAKPLFLCSEREMAAYAIINGIDYIYEECPFSTGAKSLLYKGILNKLEELSPATKIGFIKGYLRMTKKIKSIDRDMANMQGSVDGAREDNATDIQLFPGSQTLEDSAHDDVKRGREDGHCAVCGYPAFGEKCSMCRILEKFGIEEPVFFEEYSPSSLDSPGG
ncbi:MAG: phosphoadenosine phosphosulfate reductase family protein [Proteobacteria bacterium]|nr:phosphoadenosine phosphosulfate reductase family protein [Pseudomonadota bacterium]